MGLEYATWLAYGVHVPIGSSEDIGEAVDTLVADNPDRYPDLGYLYLMDYNTAFITTKAIKVRIGRYQTVPYVQSEEISWDRQIAHALYDLDYTDRFTFLDSPRWLVIADHS